MDFIIKFLFIFMCSISAYAYDNEIKRTEQISKSEIKNDLFNEKLIISLTSLSTSLDNLAKSAIKQSKTDEKFSKEYLELHQSILKTTNIVHETITQRNLTSKHKKNNDQVVLELKNQVDDLYKSKSYFSYADFAAIALTSVAVLITALGVVIAGLSFWGYKHIKSTTEKSAREVAEEVSYITTNQTIGVVVKTKLEELIDEGKFTKHLEDVVDSLIIRNNGSKKGVDWEELDEGINWKEFNDAYDNVQGEDLKS